MAQQYKFFCAPALNSEDIEEEINEFCKSVRVVNVRQEFTGGDNPCWYLLVEYLTESGGGDRVRQGRKRKRVDYQEILSPEDFSIFAKLRDWRKETADKEGVPMYVIFTNDQLAKIVQGRMTSMADLKSITGIGDARIEKYGEAVIRIVQQAKPRQDSGETNEAGGKTVQPDSGAGKPSSGVSEGGKREAGPEGGDSVQLKF